MSRDLVQMMRSWRLVAAELRRRHPELRADIEAGEAFAARWLLGRACGHATCPLPGRSPDDR